MGYQLQYTNTQYEIYEHCFFETNPHGELETFKKKAEGQ